MDNDINKANNSDMMLKHLDYVQSVIDRMAGHSATQKNLCISIVTAIAGAALVSKTPDLIYIAVVAVVVFGFLDAKYLKVERGFRELYDAIRTAGPDTATDFRMRPTDVPFHSCLASWSVWPLYTALLLALLILKWIIQCT